MVIMRGKHLLRHTSTLQVPIGLNSGESEYYALVHGAAYSLGSQAMHADWGLPVSLTVLSDSSSARAFSKRRGLGKQRHVQTRFLWLQDRVKPDHLSIVVVKGTENPAGVLTKALTRNEIMRSMGWLGHGGKIRRMRSGHHSRAAPPSSVQSVQERTQRRAHLHSRAAPRESRCGG